MLIWSFHLRHLPSGLSPSALPTKTAFLFSAMHVTRTANHIVLDLIYGEESKAWSSSSCSFLHPVIFPNQKVPVISSKTMHIRTEVHQKTGVDHVLYSIYANSLFRHWYSVCMRRTCNVSGNASSRYVCL